MASETETLEAPVTTEVVEESGATTETVAETAAETTEEFKLPDDFDWREHWSGGDEKLLKLAGRYQSPKALLEATDKLRAKLSSGKTIEPLNEDSTDEEVAAYRKALDIPETPEGYMEKLPEGTVVGDDDRPYFETFFAKMHAANAPPGLANAAIASYLEIVEEQQAEQLEAAAAAKKACEDALREEWATPGEYRRNDNILQNYVSSLPEPIRDAFDKGTGPDGVPLGYNPEIRRWLVARALEENPHATVVPGAGDNAASAIADEIASIKAKMGTPAYTKDEKMQARYRELLEAQEKMPK